jgi:hypothetical protein
MWGGRRGLALFAGVIASGCGLSTSGLFAAGDGGPPGSPPLTGPDGAPLPPSEGGAPIDGAASDSPWQPPPSDGPPVTPTAAIVGVGNVANETGIAQGAHLVYATHAARWFLFFIDDAHANLLQTISSSDFVVWTPGASLTLPASHGNQGADLTVAYADIAGDDVVHIGIGLHFPASNDRRHFHVRAAISGAAVTFGTPLQITQVNDPQLVEPDGPATLVTPDGYIWDSSGWAAYMGGTGNEIAWQSTGLDLGASWDGNMGAQQNVDQLVHTVNARALTQLPAGGLLALYELADVEPDPTNVAWSTYAVGAGWGQSHVVFGTPASQSADDWDVAEVSTTDVRLVRRSLAGAYEQSSFDGAQWNVLSAPPSDPGRAESGVVLLANGTSLALVAIGSDAANSVRVVTWDGSRWGNWSTLEGSTGSRAYLSAVSASAPGHAAVIWTQTDAGGGAFHVYGARVPGF